MVGRSPLWRGNGRGESSRLRRLNSKDVDFCGRRWRRVGMAECVAVGRRGESGGTREREPIELGETLTGGREEMSGVELIGEAAVVEAGVLLCHHCQ